MIGGVLRDKYGNWIIEYNQLIGTCSDSDAELWDIFKGVTIVIGKGFDRVFIISYSQDMIQAIQKTVTRMSNFALVRSIILLLAKMNFWSIQHVSRDHNNEADSLDKMLISNNGRIQFFCNASLALDVSLSNFL
ncbi:hypothetical protein PVK06_039919 [Gossypium arboreum]|uniref:RNase H type-1 domain-containing protein n=1 Tax=Gossypium arboreum TaxID=29729 RepID=A0ABR0N446_GOSAR|nr:hypothetical protein PVK06_039919 [Gossypium arboreum]